MDLAWIWLPDHDVGAVILTNGDPGWLIRSIFRRKLLEVLFDGRLEADDDVASAGKRFFGQMAAERKLLTLPAAANDSARLVRLRGGETTREFVGSVVVRRPALVTACPGGRCDDEDMTIVASDPGVRFRTRQENFHATFECTKPQTRARRAGCLRAGTCDDVIGPQRARRAG